MLYTIICTNKSCTRRVLKDNTFIEKCWSCGTKTEYTNKILNKAFKYQIKYHKKYQSTNKELETFIKKVQARLKEQKKLT